MREMIGLANGGRLTHTDRTVGPLHDPYGRTIIERYSSAGLMWRMVSCGLAGEWLEDGAGNKVAALRVMENDDRSAREAYRNRVEDFTGQTQYFWFNKVWGLRYAHLSDDVRELMAIDAQLMRYAM